jgi:hypothetical protein
MRTIMIGSISSIEKVFGYLWGYGNKNLTDNQKKFLELWKSLRQEILDRGNSEIRAAEQEIANYDIKWKRYRYNLPIVKPEDKNV